MFGVGRGSVSLPFVMIYGLEVKEVKRFLRRAFAYCAHRESAPKEIVHKLARCMGMKKWQEEFIVLVMDCISSQRARAAHGLPWPCHLC